MSLYPSFRTNDFQVTGDGLPHFLSSLRDTGSRTRDT